MKIQKILFFLLFMVLSINLTFVFSINANGRYETYNYVEESFSLNPLERAFFNYSHIDENDLFLYNISTDGDYAVFSANQSKYEKYVNFEIIVIEDENDTYYGWVSIPSLFLKIKPLSGNYYRCYPCPVGDYFICLFNSQTTPLTGRIEIGCLREITTITTATTVMTTIDSTNTTTTTSEVTKTSSSMNQTTEFSIVTILALFPVLFLKRKKQPKDF